MRYVEPDDLDTALQCLASEDARPLAGGATLVAMMNEGLLQPASLVGLKRIAGLDGVERRADGCIVIGAMRRHADVAIEPALTGGTFLIREAAGQIAHPAVRNMGTLGGSVAHADPNADYPCALLAADAVVLIQGIKGLRREPIDTFFVDYMQTVLQPGELIVGIELPPDAGVMTSAYLKVSRVDGDYATVSLAIRAGWSAQGHCESLRVAIGSCGATPLRSAPAEALLVAADLDDAAIEEAGALLVAVSDPVDDFRGSAQYRQWLIPGLLGRAVRLVRQRRMAEEEAK